MGIIKKFLNLFKSGKEEEEAGSVKGAPGALR